MAELIDRQAAIKTVLTYLVEYCGAAFDEDMQRTLKERLDSLPSAEPERKTGRWTIRETAYESVEAKCSCCGFETLVDEPGNGLHMVNDLLYCPNCGADMRGEKNEPNNKAD